MSKRVNQRDRAGQSATTSPALLIVAIRSIPIGLCPWGPKMLLEYLATEAGTHGEPADHIATTHPELADCLGCNHVTAGDLVDALVRLGLVTFVRRLFRGERDERAPDLVDGGSILRIHPTRIYRLARRNEGPMSTRYRPASEPAVAQHAGRQRELEAELARLREQVAELRSIVVPAQPSAVSTRRRRVAVRVDSGAVVAPSAAPRVAVAGGGAAAHVRSGKPVRGNERFSAARKGVAEAPLPVAA